MPADRKGNSYRDGKRRNQSDQQGGCSLKREKWNWNRRALWEAGYPESKGISLSPVWNECSSIATRGNSHERNPNTAWQPLQCTGRNRIWRPGVGNLKRDAFWNKIGKSTAVIYARWNPDWSGVWSGRKWSIEKIFLWPRSWNRRVWRVFVYSRTAAVVWWRCTWWWRRKTV